MAATTERPLAAVPPETEDDVEAIAAANSTPDVETTPDDARSIEELAETEKPIAPSQMAIPGTRDRITLSAGGKPPTSSEARIMGSRRPIEGQFEKGEIVTLLVEAKVGAVEFIDTTDDWGNVQKTVRVQKFRMLSVTPQTT